MNEVYSITVSAMRDELDAGGIIPDANWSEAWQCYANMMTGGARSLFPEAEVEVVEQASAAGIEVGADDPAEREEAEAAMTEAAERVYSVWCEWVSNQPWGGC